MSLPDLIDERFEELARELRSATPAAPAELRARVRALSSGAPEPRAVRLPRRRRLGLALAALLTVAVAGSALIYGFVTSGPSEERAKGPAIALESRAAGAAATDQAAPGSVQRGVILPPSRTRLQDYRARIRIRVSGLEALSRVTARAMRIARRLGGFVASVDYGAPGGREGDAELILRIPTAHVQEAILSFSELGTFVAQQVSIRDAQRRVDDLGARIAGRRGAIARLEVRLRDDALTSEERARLQRQLAGERSGLARLARARQGALERGRLSTVSLSLTTRAPAVVEKLDRRGRVERSLDGAAGVLAREASITLYAVIVAGPALLLAAVAVLLAGVRRRRVERRLLEPR